jgi:hypothetical protein
MQVHNYEHHENDQTHVMHALNIASYARLSSGKYLMLIEDIIYCPEPVTNVIKDFVLFACRELQLDSMPEIEIITGPVHNQNSTSFAAYSPEKKIYLYVRHRHIMDVLRSLCHEMVHYRQHILNQLHAGSGKTGSDQENEANAVAGQIMRKFGHSHPQLF